MKLENYYGSNYSNYKISKSNIFYPKNNEEIFQIRLQKFARSEAKLIIKTQIERKKFLYSILNDKRVKELLKDKKYKQAKTRVKKMLKEWL